MLRTKPLRYKIVLISSPERESFEYLFSGKSHLCCEILDSETWNWKKLDDIIISLPSSPSVFQNIFISFKNKPVSIYRKFYWNLHGRNEVFGFNLENESWEFFALPRPFEHRKDNMVLVEFEAKLSFVCVFVRKAMYEIVG